MLTPVLRKADDKMELVMQEIYCGKHLWEKRGVREGAWSFDTCKDEGKEKRLNKKVLVWWLSVLGSELPVSRVACLAGIGFYLCPCCVQSLARSCSWETGHWHKGSRRHNAAIGGMGQFLSNISQWHTFMATTNPKPHTSETLGVPTAWFSRTRSGKSLV